MTSPRTALPTPNPTDENGIVSWVHFGDLHITMRTEDNFRDFLSLVDEVNRVMKGSLHFAYLPGDNADHGRTEEYELVREGMDQLRLPWFAIVGDHDVHQKSHANFLQYMMPQAYYAFGCGACCFYALDSFASDDPKVFDVSNEQLEWLDGELKSGNATGKGRVLFLHCYPSELRESYVALRHLIRDRDVLLVDMGHTHYNEIANDGCTLYTATRSTGQIEEGPAGFSITNIDSGIVSWRFKPLGEWPLVMVTAPGDVRLRTRHALQPFAATGRMRVRVKAWSDQKLLHGFATMAGQTVPLKPIAGSAVWETELEVEQFATGVHPLTVELTDEGGRVGRDIVRVAAGLSNTRETDIRSERDTDCVIGAWPERGILGTQLGPNKNGRKW
jgi:3',5'-cyclic-AMP phosphodiesterase